MQTEKRIIRIPQGARIGPEQKPIYGFVEIEAFCARGLCVHRDPARPKIWNVTHESSGLRISPLEATTKKRALENMQAALCLEFDWAMPEKETLAAMRESRGLVDAIWKIAQESNHGK